MTCLITEEVIIQRVASLEACSPNTSAGAAQAPPEEPESANVACSPSQSALWLSGPGPAVFLLLSPPTFPPTCQPADK